MNGGGFVGIVGIVVLLDLLVVVGVLGIIIGVFIGVVDWLLVVVDDMGCDLVDCVI